MKYSITQQTYSLALSAINLEAYIARNRGCPACLNPKDTYHVEP